jgi:hypothetical protein
MTRELEAECRACNGEGQIEHPHLRRGYASYLSESPPDPAMVDCEECNGTGWISCDWGGVNCPFPAHCYCEAAYDRQQADNASEPPKSINEHQRQAWRARNALRGGYSL